MFSDTCLLSCGMCVEEMVRNANRQIAEHLRSFHSLIAAIFRYMESFEKLTQCYLWLLITRFASILRQGELTKQFLTRFEYVFLYFRQVPATPPANRSIWAGVTHFNLWARYDLTVLGQLWCNQLKAAQSEWPLAGRLQPRSVRSMTVHRRPSRHSGWELTIIILSDFVT